VTSSTEKNVNARRSMLEIRKDKKSPTWIITRTDKEGFHHQIQLPREELYELYSILLKILFR
jgi:hypothetical protein